MLDLTPSQESLRPGLYLVSTPIGNMRDITLRALDTLKSVDRVLCEDTRRTGKLLSAYDISQKLVQYHDYSTQNDRNKIIKHLKDGEKMALVSDAGTPLISDPGFKLVRECLNEGIEVTSCPGANALLPALQLSGYGSDKFCFLGFLPSKAEARAKVLSQFSAVPAPLIFYETAPRLSDCLKLCHEVLGKRKVTIAREMTKLYEEIIRGDIETLPDDIAGKTLKGEIVVVIDKAEETVKSKQIIETELNEAMEHMSLKQAVKEITVKSGWKKNDVYALALEIRDRE